MKCDRLVKMIRESIMEVMDEESEMAQYPEWIKKNCELMVLHNRDFNEKYYWLVNALLKKSKRGVEISREQLANSSVVGGIVREVFKQIEVDSRMHLGEYKECRYLIADMVLREVNDELEYGNE